MSPNQLNIKLITKKQEKSLFAFFEGNNICKSNEAPYCDTLQRKKPTKKGANMQKSRKLVFMKTGFSEKKDHVSKIKLLLRANCI